MSDMWLSRLVALASLVVKSLLDESMHLLVLRQR
jgi:hypothetical protein